jgi:L-threonylcarbamoyladenylate synthase
MTVYQGETKDVVSYINELVKKKNPKDVGILATEETKDCYPVGTVICVGSREKHTVARELFGALREFDHKGVKWIYAESFEKEQFGAAIMNRLRKAAGQRVVEVPKMK